MFEENVVCRSRLVMMGKAIMWIIYANKNQKVVGLLKINLSITFYIPDKVSVEQVFAAPRFQRSVVWSCTCCFYRCNQTNLIRFWGVCPSPVKHLVFTGHRGREGNFIERCLYFKHSLHAKPPAPFTTHMWVVVHDQQVLSAPLRACPLVGSHKPGDVVMLQQR